MRRASFYTALIMAMPLMANYGWNDGYPYGCNAPQSPHFYAEVDYLAWFANVEGNSYGTLLGMNSEINTDGYLTSQSFDTTDLHYLNKWDSGVRGTVGFRPPKSSWDIALVYNYFQSEHKHRPHTATARSIYDATSGGSTLSGNVLVPSFGIPVEIPGLVGPGSTETITYLLRPRFKFFFNELDLEIGDEFRIASDVSFRPFVGFRGLWTEYDSRTHFEVDTVITGLSPASYSDTLFLHNHNYFNGFGARAGFDAGYEILRGLDVYGGIAGSLLWGYIHSRSFYVGDEEGITGDGINKSSVHSSMLTFDFAFGVRYNVWMNCNRNLLSLRFGWEQHLFTHINRNQAHILAPTLGAAPPGDMLPSSVYADRNIGRGDLTLSGFVVGLSYAF